MPWLGHHELSHHLGGKGKAADLDVVQFPDMRRAIHSSVFRSTVILLHFMLADSTQPHQRKYYLARLEILLSEKNIFKHLSAILLRASSVVDSVPE